MYKKNNRIDVKNWLLIGIVFLSLVIRILYIIANNSIETDGAGYALIDTDGAGYALMAESLAQGKGLLPWGETAYFIWSPLYPILIAPLYSILNDSELAGRFISFIASIATVFITWYLGKRAFGQKTGMLAATLVALSVPLIKMSWRVITEPTYSFLMMGCALLTILLFKRFTWLGSVKLGLALGLFYLSRPEGLIPAVCIISVFFGGSLVYRNYRISLLKYGTVTLIALLFILLTYLTYVHAKTGEWMLTGKTKNNWYISHVVNQGLKYEKVQYGLNETATVLGTSRLESPQIVAAIAENPTYYIYRYVKSAYRMGVLFCRSMGLLVPFILIGLIGLLRNPQTRLDAFLSLLFLSPLVLYPIFYIQNRNIETLIPLVCLYAARGFLDVLSRLNKFSIYNRFGNIVLLILFLSVLNPFVKELQMAMRIKSTQQIHEHKEAGLWLKERVPQDFSIMSRKPWVAYYSRRKLEVMPFAKFNYLIEYAEYRGVDLIVIDERYIPSTRPQLKFLLKPSQAPCYLKPIYSSTNAKDKKIIIYRLDRENFCQTSEQLAE
ncbi:MULTISPECIES: ArnT family glycosyltransferase [unclassified Coleofasciculus]|uniref:ArnT family glycosyltransferase n=1 Tax=unclassified Coleofasciculus TaxID=2692782 RepID=UPI00187E1DFD|nr:MULTISPECIES: glycosyltransferase family 39 protein [unclassified Coleofasciculus]MBE9125744.1 glycosyltransferase family 39 protein [Coleofasciculus sp. LEGE 07081]MBE9147232.1 glycosyltransferase family 39 protein [Coleofasciculus sp. LEGE 07092]